MTAATKFVKSQTSPIFIDFTSSISWSLIFVQIDLGM